MRQIARGGWATSTVSAQLTLHDSHFTSGNAWMRFKSTTCGLSHLKYKLQLSPRSGRVVRARLRVPPQSMFPLQDLRDLDLDIRGPQCYV